MTAVICLLERLLACAQAKQWTPCQVLRSSQATLAMWRAATFGATTSLRLIYMLIAMTFHAGLILTIVTSLSLGQFLIEYRDVHDKDLLPDAHGHAYTSLPSESYALKNPALSSSEQSDSGLAPMYRDVPASPAPLPSSTPHRSRTRPESIFIHPNESNIARADAVALQLGLSGATDFVSNAGLVAGTASAGVGQWETGKGKDLARALLRPK
ncbi:hypothetical protein PUNSTDRAFT_117524 [Punctularia strigosozonata HHB-11173 SS5]|uniref:uncharacterized protein n=1 Tax=Punctularia strigosozonata (strain HHB-11173) TaxID=741275 RepID=UPI00044179E4|nr:uncharacterized protein PUNSTDRAFT_117524 [Punctularia strigosozonata HHB-11173 SS5]EIN13866.1 hypothetical protein PUNSTDRAFT_117524 [Punctularia strigosozonata HHB-11173 SS5]